jgi:hypothetical protein
MISKNQTDGSLSPRLLCGPLLCIEPLWSLVIGEGCPSTLDVYVKSQKKIFFALRKSRFFYMGWLTI